MSQDFYQSFTAARLFEKTSAKGNRYFIGRMGAVRVSLLRSGDVAEDGSPIWNLMFSEAPPREPESENKPKQPPRQPKGPSSANAAALQASQSPRNVTVSDDTAEQLSQIFEPREQSQ